MAEYTTVQAGLTAIALTIATVGTGFISAKIRDNETTFNLRIAGSTLLIALVAGAIIVYQGLQVNATTIGIAIGIAVPLVDKLWNTLAPEHWGGKSPADYFTQGAGAGLVVNNGSDESLPDVEDSSTSTTEDGSVDEYDGVGAPWEQTDEEFDQLEDDMQNN